MWHIVAVYWDGYPVVLIPNCESLEWALREIARMCREGDYRGRYFPVRDDEVVYWQRQQAAHAAGESQEERNAFRSRSLLWNPSPSNGP